MAAPETPETGFASRVWRSIFRGPIVPTSDRDRKWIVFNTLVLHLRPIKVPVATLRYSHTFGLGGMSLVLFGLLAGTGILLMFVYSPSETGAYDSILSLRSEYLFGELVRNVHHFSANLVIVVALLHLLRVFFTGGFHGPRRFNWVVGLGLLLCVLASNFTGYLLPWDQLSYWAVTISTAMLGYVPLAGGWLQEVIRGGPEVDGETLNNFYTLHTTLVPVLWIGLMGWHFWRVRKAGGVVLPRRGESGESAEPSEKVLFLPELLLRETAVALALIAVVLLLAIFFAAPLGAPANPGMSPNPAKAPWYFLGFQELLMHFHPAFAVFVIPLLVLGALLAIPYLRYDDERGGVWFHSDSGRRGALLAALIGVPLTVVWVLFDEWLANAGGWLPTWAPWVRSGLLPLAAVLLVAAGFHLWIRRSVARDRNAAVQATFVLLAVSFVVLTVIGIFFRGAGMALSWPWNV